MSLFGKKTGDSAHAPDLVKAHAAESERLRWTVAFLERFGPVAGHARQPGRLVDEDLGDRASLLTGCRDEAVIAAFKAVGRLCNASFQFPQQDQRK